MMRDTTNQVLVVGLGEVGNPLLEILSRVYHVQGKDLDEVNVDGPIDVMHICYPYKDESFIDTTVSYIQRYNPGLVIINSTVMPGTNRAVYEQTEAQIAYSPVRGKHVRMRDDMLRYTKFVAGVSEDGTRQAVQHFERTGMKTAVFSSCEALELAKLLETTYYGVLIAWAQEMERFCHAVDADYNEIMRFTEEIDYLPPVVFQPGFIGGHCVISNSFLLDQVRHSDFIDCIRRSNELKAEEWRRAGRSLEERLTPRRIGVEEREGAEVKGGD